MQEMLDRSFPGRSSAHIPFSCRLLAYSTALQRTCNRTSQALLCMQLDRSRTGTGTGTGTSRSAAGRGRPGSHSHAQEIPPAAARSTLGRAGSTGPPPAGLGWAGEPTNERSTKARQANAGGRGARARSGLVAEATWGCRGRGIICPVVCSGGGSPLATARTARTPAHVTLRAARCLAPLPASAPRPDPPVIQIQRACVPAGRDPAS